MSVAAILVPDFTLILIGFLLMRLTDWGPQFWAGLERLIYYILFPSLLFYSTARTQFDFASTGRMLEAALAASVAAIALGWLAKPLFRAGPMVFESGVQTAFRFNSYIALAAASRLGGEQGTSLMALIIGFAVPLCNMAAVHALVHKNGKLLAELAKNPLLVATASGMAFNLLGFHLPEIAGAILGRLGNASIAIGLIAVGAGLRLSGLHEAKAMASYFLAVKLVAMPAIGVALAHWLGLPPLQARIVTAFCAMPTASSAYVLAARIGGNGPFVAFLISAGTVLSVFTLPVWLALAG
jgi:predicted permease